MTPNSPETDLRPEQRHRMLKGRLLCRSVFAYGRESPLHAPRGQIRSIAHKQICTPNNATGCSSAGCAADLFSLTAESRLYMHPEGRSVPLPTNRSAPRTTPRNTQWKVATQICFRFRPGIISITDQTKCIADKGSVNVIRPVAELVEAHQPVEVTADPLTGKKV